MQERPESSSLFSFYSDFTPPDPPDSADPPDPPGHGLGSARRALPGPEAGLQASGSGAAAAVARGHHHLRHPAQLPVRPLEARAGRAASPAARGAQRAEREPQDRLHRRGARAVLLRRSVTEPGQVVSGRTRVSEINNQIN